MISRNDVIDAIVRAYAQRDDNDTPQEAVNRIVDEIMLLLDSYTQQILDRYISDGSTPRRLS